MTAADPERALRAAEGAVLATALRVARAHANGARECACVVCTVANPYRAALAAWGAATDDFGRPRKPPQRPERRNDANQ